MGKKQGIPPDNIYTLFAGILAAISAIIILLVSKRSASKYQNIHIDNFPIPTVKDQQLQLSETQIMETAPAINAKAPTNRDHLTVANPPPIQTTIWSPPTKYLVGTGLFIFLLFGIYIGRSVIPLVILGALIAFTIQPVVHFLQVRFRFRRALAISFTYFIVFLFILLIPLILIPSIINAIDLVTEIDFPSMILNISKSIAEFLGTLTQIPLIGPVLGSLFDPFLATMENLPAEQPAETLNLNIAFSELISRLASTLGVLVRAVGAVASAMVAVFFAFLFSVYLSFDGYKFKAVIPRLMPTIYKDEIENLLISLVSIWESFLHGQIALMCIVGVIVWFGTTLLGLPQPIFFGFLSGMLEMIPTLGPLLAFIPAVLVALIFGSSTIMVGNLIFAMIIAGFYLLVQFFENQFIVPRVLGKAVDLHPLVVLVGALAAGSQFGILGIFLAAPVIASTKVVFLYLYDKILETPTPQTLETKEGFIKKFQSFFRKIGGKISKLFKRSVL